MVPSPCTQVCRLDRATGWCEGCGRTIEEIAGWAVAGEAAQRAILVRLPSRLAELRKSRADR